MSSATINRPSGALPSAARSTHFGDFTTASRTPNTDEKPSQTSTLGQTFGSNNWEASGGIWGNAIGSGLPNGKRDASRSREETTFDFPSGSSQLAQSSVADPWGTPRNVPWAVHANSPTKSSSGNSSPIRHRGSNPNGGLILEAQKTSSYISAGAVIGQGPGLANLPGRAAKSNLDPSSGAFNYPYQKRSFPLDDKENVVQEIHGAYGNGSTSRDRSAPHSRHSAGSASTTGSGVPNPNYPFSHTPNNSLHIQRSSVGRTSSFPTVPVGRFEMNDQLQELDSNYFESSRGLEKEGANGYMEFVNSGPEQNFSSSSSQQQNSQLFPWNNGGSSAKISSYFPDTGADFIDQLNPSKPYRATERVSISPGSDYRRQPSPRFVPVSHVASGEQDAVYVRGMRPATIPDLERGMQRMQFGSQQQYFSQPIMFNGQFTGQYTQQHPYDYPAHPPFRPNGQYGYHQPMQMPPFSPSITAPRGPARDQDVGHGVRSVLLEEFRANQKNSSKKYDLKDIYNHVVEFSGDQHGSRFIQQKLETANSDDKDQVFREIQPNALQLMTDVFGNYVIQKLFEHGNQIQKKVLAETMKNHVHELSVQMYGCRVVQKALEHVLADQQAELVRELQPDVLKCVKDQNGNHVIQKAIERVPTEHIQFVIEAFRGQVHVLATHPYGCRVIQRMLEYCNEKDQAAVLHELHACAQMLITDQYGNYVVQHVIAHGKPEDRDRLIKTVTAQLLTFSKHKFASNVVEKSIQFGSEEQRRAIVAAVTNLHSDGTSPLQLMMKDQFGNYVIQKLLGQLKGEERERLVEDIKPQLMALKKYNYSKQITSIEKIIFTGPQPSYLPSYNSPKANTMAFGPVSKTLPLEINSSVPTPSLTMEQNSPQSSSLPSTNVSTVDDGPIESAGTQKPALEQATPQIQIETV